MYSYLAKESLFDSSLAFKIVYSWQSFHLSRPMRNPTIYEVQSESSRTVLVVLFVFKEESQNFTHKWEKHFSTHK